MSQIEKLIARLKSSPSDFNYAELRRIMLHFGYAERTSGKTSGSRVRFVDDEKHVLTMHKRHPQKELLPYQISEAIAHLSERGLI